MYVTFYSYKGGVGRTMALANVACLLAQDQVHPQKVLIIDLDLEAPGIHRLFPPQEEYGKGFVDLAYEFSESNNSLPLDVSSVIYHSDIDGIDVLPAGRVGQDYCEKLQSLYWPGFMTPNPVERGVFFDALIQALDYRDYDYVLIDSRTGLSDQAGIATQLLPDLVLMIFRLTEQNLEGVDHLYETTKAQLIRRGRNHVSILPVASFVMSQCSPEQDSRRARAKEIFGTDELSYIRFDADLVSEERLFCLRDITMWPTPPIVEDYQRLCRDVRRGNLKDSRTVINRVESCVRSGDEAEVSRLLRDLLLRKPRLARAWDVLYEQGYSIRDRWEMFDDVAETILAKDSNNSFALEWNASMHMAEAKELESGAINLAKECLESAIKYDPDNDRLHRKLAETHACLGDLPSAMESLKTAMRIAPRSIRLRMLLAQMCVRRGREYMGLAADVLREAGSRTPYPLMAYLMSFIGTPSEAEEAQSAVAEQSFDWHRKQMILAHCSVLQGDTPAALLIADAAVTSHDNAPDDSDIHNWAEFYLCAKEYGRVISFLGTSAARERDSPLIPLAKYLEDRGRTISAEEVRKAWRGVSWSFLELLFLRERLKHDSASEFRTCIPIFEQIIRESDFDRPEVDIASVYWRKAAMRNPNVLLRAMRGVRATFSVRESEIEF